MTRYEPGTEEYEAVVYDLDGTLVHLAVEWDVVAREVEAALEARGVRVADPDLWGMLERAGETEHEAAVEGVIAAHERRGARESRRLPFADALPHDVPVAVCSLNCEAACRIALEVHDLDAHVDAVVGRDSVATKKPHPEPLLTAVEALGTTPERSLFVGDSERDEVTAERAGTAFRYV
ncbi:HAD family hydrolase [Halomarina ordinaria]|uniref:HAD family hydrolase n=1 Tax=Halomarina ordinaria TaxID=3033939 RepID=A0ABD5U9D1_9EURY|nr:HAD hydrolase-like protein [Halomarina sp. PSRA2]